MYSAGSRYVASYSTAKRILDAVDRVVSQHRFCFFIYFGVVVKVWNLTFMKELTPQPLVKTRGTGNFTLQDAETAVEPLTRTNLPPVVESMSVSGKGLPKRRKILVADINSKLAAGTQLATRNDESEATRVLQRVLDGSNEPMHGQQLTNAYITLSNMYSARGQYEHASAAVGRAVQIAWNAESRASARLAFARLELKHHRYEAAAAQFAHVLNNGDDGGKATLDPVLSAAALGGAGWAELMRGNFEEAVSRFREVLKETLRYNDRIGLITQASCKPRGHVLDGCHAYALAGLSTVLAHQGHNSTDAAIPTPDDVAACAASFLVSVGADSVAYHSPCDVTHARRALGLAYVAMKQTHKARHQFGQALRLEQQSSYSWPARGSVGDICNDDLTRCSHTKLSMGLVDFQAGDSQAAARHVDQLVSAASGVPEEAIEWLVRFSQANEWLIEEGPRHSALLAERVASLRPEYATDLVSLPRV